MVARRKLSKPLTKTTAVVRRKMIAKPKPNPVVRKKINAQFEAKRMALHKHPKQDYSFKVGPRLVIALQVKNSLDPAWGTIKHFEVHESTGFEVKNDYRKELQKVLTGWAVNGYFGGDAQFQIAEIKTPPKEYIYFV